MRMSRTRREHKNRPRRSWARLRLELLEDRTLLNGTQWAAFFNGLTPAPDLQTQAQEGQNLLHAAGLQDQKVAVVQAVDLSGTFIVQTPDNVTQDVLTAELQAVPGFVFVQDLQVDPVHAEKYNPGEPNGADLINADGLNNNPQLPPPDAPPPGGPVTTPPGTNDVRTNNDAGGTTTSGFTHSETTTIAFGNTVLVGFNDSGEYNLTGRQFTGWSRSTDGGATFTDGGALPTNPNGDVGDPVLARDNTTGRVYFATLQFSGSGMDVFHSDNGGATWSAPAQGAPGKNGFQDKEWIAVDNFSGPGQGNVYLANRDFGSGNGIYFYRSTNQGATFGPNGGTAIALAGATQGAFVTVTPDHAVEVFWYNGSVIQMRKSTDQGVTFGAPVTVVSGLIGGVNGDLGLTGQRSGTSFRSNFRSSEFPHAAVNPVNGNIYVTYDNRGTAAGDKADVFLVQSTNGGTTWSSPLKVNDDTTHTDQWQPTIAVTPDGSKVGIFYYSRQEDPTNDNLFKYYGRVATISGSTLNFTPSFAVSDTASLPEFGRDGDVNPIYMGDYNTATALPSGFFVSWSDNRFNIPGSSIIKEPDVFFKQINVGLAVTSTVPAVGSLVVGTAPTVFTVNVTDPINPASLSASAFKVNGIAATSDSYTSGSTSITFTFASTPVTTEGVQTMHIDAGAFTRASDGSPVGQFDGTFRYATVQLQVTSTEPANNAVVSLPFTDLKVHFNRAYDPATLRTSNLVLSQGTVTAATVVDATTADYTLSGIVNEGPLTFTMAAGALKDTNGNPMLAYAGNFNLQIGLAPLPAATPINPLGSLVYQTKYPGRTGIDFLGDTDSFTINVNAGQQITVLVHPTASTLQPTIQLFDPGANPIGTATASAAGQEALLQTAAASTSGTYKITVGGASGTLGTYTVQVYLNAALEAEKHGGPSDDTRATAQALSFNSLGGSASRAAILGTTDGGSGNYTATAVTPTFTDISATGQRILQFTDDSGQLLTPAQLGTFQFTLYGQTYNSMVVNTDGWLTLGTQNESGYFNGGDLRFYPHSAAIAAFWNDLIFIGSSGAVYYQVFGSGTNQKLIIEWKNAQGYYYPGTGYTFETVLDEATGDIQVNYQNLAYGTPYDNGRLATLGVKDVGNNGAQQRLLVSYRNGPNQYIGSNKSTLLVPPPPPTPDYYSFNLGAGESATLALKGLTGGNLTLDLQNAAGTTLASGFGGATNLDKAINNFVAPAAGTYYARIGGATVFDGGKGYDLVVTRNADFSTEPNDSFLSGPAQYLVPVNGQAAALGYVGQAGNPNDVYEVSLTDGQTLTAQTATPGAGSGEFHNALVPLLNVYDPNGNLVASAHNSAPDGHNALVSYTVPSGGAGLYFVEVKPFTAAAGEYALTIQGPTSPTDAPFTVTATTPADKAYLSANPRTMTVSFNHDILLTSLAAADLQVDGLAATGFTVVDGSTVTFTLPTLPNQEVHTVSIAGGLIDDVSGEALTDYSSYFLVNTVPPNVISSSIQENDEVLSADGTLTYTMQFSEPLNPSTVTATAFTLHGNGANKNYAPSSFSYIIDTSTLTLTYSGLNDDFYQLRANSSLLKDYFGLNLDGETVVGGNPVWPIPPGHSGNGIPGGDFTVDFGLDITGSVAYPTPLTPVKPLGSLIYQGDPTFSTIISAGEQDAFTLNVDAGQTETVLVHPVSGSLLQPTITVTDPNSNSGTASASAAGQDAILQTFPTSTTGTYTITVGGVGTSIGGYTVQVFLNTALKNVVTATPVSLSSAFNQVGIVADGSKFAFNGGLDNAGSALSGNLLGSIQSYNGVPFNIGAAGVNDVVSAVGQTIALPAGSYSSLRLLATAVFGNQPGQSFKVTYTDGTTATFTQGVSDWFTPQNFPGEADAVPMAYRDVSNGTKDNRTFYVYGYSFALDPTKTVQSITLPNNSHVKVLAETLALDSNQTRAGAQDLTGSFLALPNGASRGAVLGTQDSSDYYSFHLDAGEQVALNAVLGTTNLFGAPSFYSTGGSGEYNIAAGDLLGNGKTDLVVTNEYSHTVSVLLGNGDGTFQSPHIYSINTGPSPGYYPIAVALADLRGTGKPDIVVSDYYNSNSTSGGVSVLLNNGDGTFGAPTTYTVGGYEPSGLAVGNLRPGGKPDIVVTNYGYNGTVSVLLNNGNGTFGAKTDYAAGHYPRGVTLADLRGTGANDIIVGNYYNDSFSSGGVSVLLNNGSGTGFSRTSYTTGGYGTAGVTTGDLHGNGKLDIVAANEYGSNVSVLPGNGNGTFGTQTSYATNSYPVSVAVGDINGDGKPDIVTANYYGTVSTLLNNGNGTLGTHKDYNAGSYHFGYSDLVLADFNGDNLPDIATPNFYGGNVSVLLNQTPRLELQDSNGNVVRTATSGPTNVDLATSDYVAPGSGTYYIHVTGVGKRDYNLLVTTNAEFQHTPNQSFATAQDFTGTQGVLGALTPAAAPSTVVPNANANTEGDFNNGFPFNIGAFGIPSMRYQQIYAHAQFASGGVIDEIDFRKDGTFGSNFSTSNIDVKINLSYAATTATNPSAVFANNIGAGVVTVFDGLLNLSSTGSGSPFPFDIVIPFSNNFTYDPTQGDLLVDVFMRNAPVTTFFDAVGTSQNVTSRIYSNSSVNDTTGSAFQSGLVTRFDFAPLSPENWYKESLTAGQTVTFATTTPSDDPGGEFHNTLSPHIQLYDPSGNLVATGTKLADGRNETITYTALVSGDYRIRLTGDNGTLGEYFLDPVETGGSAAPAAVPAGGELVGDAGLPGAIGFSALGVPSPAADPGDGLSAGGLTAAPGSQPSGNPGEQPDAIASLGLFAGILGGPSSWMAGSGSAVPPAGAADPVLSADFGVSAAALSSMGYGSTSRTALANFDGMTDSDSASPSLKALDQLFADGFGWQDSANDVLMGMWRTGRGSL